MRNLEKYPTPVEFRKIKNETATQVKFLRAHLLAIQGKLFANSLELCLQQENLSNEENVA
jgi:hypothetical protein